MKRIDSKEDLKKLALKRQFNILRVTIDQAAFCVKVDLDDNAVCFLNEARMLLDELSARIRPAISIESPS